MSLKIYRPKGSAVWHYRGTLAGHRLRSSTGATDRKTAQKLAAEVAARFWQRGLDKKSLTFPKAVALYLAAGKSERFIGKLEDYWKDKKISEMTRGAIKQSAIDIYPKASAATRNRQVLVPTIAIINHCAEMDLCENVRIKRFEVETEVKKPITLEWIEVFCAHAVTPRIAALALFLFSTGARISEAVPLDWADFNFQKRMALLNQTKVGAERLAHLPMRAMLAVANLPRDVKPFHYEDTRHAAAEWDETIKLAGLERLTFHSCRHGFATGLLRAGIDVVTVAKLGGWKSPAHVFKTYGHANDDPTLTDRLFDKVSDKVAAQIE